MKKVWFIPIIFVCQYCFAQPKISKLDKNSIPKNIHYAGHIVNAVRWADTTGDHIIITTETGETQSKGQDLDDSYKDAALYAYHYIVQTDSLKLIWKVYDFVKECPLDLKANYIKNTFAVTDLNKDGKAEIWKMYKTACRGDVSPSDMKIIMYEDNKKYAVRGTNKVKVSEKEYMGGQYTFDEAFKKAPEVFRQYAIQLWKKNIVDTLE
ncbi:MAG TPA: hypothetical protein VNS32_28465 [Flavisolibacter sp.]|nr:hypothetical protein [Flavisolibacter sp.]